MAGQAQGDHSLLRPQAEHRPGADKRPPCVEQRAPATAIRAGAAGCRSDGRRPVIPALHGAGLSVGPLRAARACGPAGWTAHCPFTGTLHRLTTAPTETPMPVMDSDKRQASRAAILANADAQDCTLYRLDESDPEAEEEDLGDGKVLFLGQFEA